ncbi:MAG: PIN domain-containing protein [Pseudomonadota bacterium]|uniref:PIN domain-containing protein n=1 Tax=Candidatus Desulfatibia profunda TaxID=2841695 RepID=A0A8J6NS32_9BACT|nr:PIN domain-containing protein [Candidatus Desulfatibia profunda]MBL7180882.1 PIN domain-containing protein [Desulfobacterales bacterium]MBU0698567.1 PIN domain-containing protein [Pseudomonadota bacterium]
MITAVDTNILVDILEPDPVYGPVSRDALKQCLREGSVIASEVVWAEVVTAYGHAIEEVVDALIQIGIEYKPMSLEAALEAARCWFEYRKQGRDRNRIAADFLIGGYALMQSDRLLTRDRGFYRKYFTPLRVKSPS